MVCRGAEKAQRSSRWATIRCRVALHVALTLIRTLTLALILSLILIPSLK